VRSAWVFSRRKTGVTGAGRKKETAQKTARFVPVYTGKESTVLIVIPSRVKDSCRLDTRYRKNYRMSMIENLNAIKISGIRNFIKTEKNRWTCSKCGGTSVFTGIVVIPVEKRKYKAFFFKK
jgi:hypothetical protein